MLTDTMAECPLPSRSSVHLRIGEESPLAAYGRAQRVARSGGRSSRPRAAVRWSGATVTTGMLAAVLAVPAVAAATTNDSQTGSKVAGKFGVEQSWAGIRSASAEETADLTKEPAAASRARLRVPIEVSPCLADIGVAANGSRDITAQARVYMPLQEGTYTASSYFGYRIHPIFGDYRLHEGDDYAAPEGTPIYSVADGVVTEAQWQDAMGFYVVIKHTMTDGSVYFSRYLHQWESSVIVGVGQEVKAGQRIGAVGNAGNSTGAHLHLEIHDSNNTPISPSNWLEQRGAVFLGEAC